MNTLLRYWKEWTVIAVLLLAGANGRAETIDGILAIVNDDVITDSEFQDRTGTFFGTSRRAMRTCRPPTYCGARYSNA